MGDAFQAERGSEAREGDADRCSLRWLSFFSDAEDEPLCMAPSQEIRA
jgi:hypothetical protein